LTPLQIIGAVVAILVGILSIINIINGFRKFFKDNVKAISEDKISIYQETEVARNVHKRMDNFEKKLDDFISTYDKKIVGDAAESKILDIWLDMKEVKKIDSIAKNHDEIITKIADIPSIKNQVGAVLQSVLDLIDLLNKHDGEEK